MQTNEIRVALIGHYQGAYLLRYLAFRIIQFMIIIAYLLFYVVIINSGFYVKI